MGLPLSYAITRLLHQHDCVIVPGLGGFVASQRPASRDRKSNMIFPPSRRVSFNRQLQVDDGLLANFIVQAESIRYEDAKKKIAETTEQWIQQLSNGRKVQVGNIGNFTMDNDRHILFEPGDISLPSEENFGLFPVHAVPVKKLTPHFEKPTALPEKKMPVKFNLKILEIVPVAAVLILMFLSPRYASTINSGMAAIEEFLFPPITNTTSHPAAGKAIDKTAPAAPEMPAVKTELPSNTDAAEENSLPDAGTSVPEITENKILPEQENAFYIIAGCFRIEENANALCASLMQKGFEASVLGKNARGLTIVSAASFPTLESAESELTRFQTEVAAGAWILKKQD